MLDDHSVVCETYGLQLENAPSLDRGSELFLGEGQARAGNQTLVVKIGASR